MSSSSVSHDCGELSFTLSPLLARTAGLRTSHVRFVQVLVKKPGCCLVRVYHEARSESGLVNMYVSGRLESHGTASRNFKRALVY
jgi:hypothetical protein